MTANSNHRMLLDRERQMRALFACHFSTVQLGICEIAVLERRLTQIGIQKFGSDKNHSVEKGSTQITLGKIGVCEIDIGEVIPAQRRL
jgi:hypothetical protein